MLLSLVFTVLSGGLILKIKGICVIALTSRGFYRNYNFLYMRTWVKLMEMPYIIAFINIKKLLGLKQKRIFIKSSKLDSAYYIHWCHGNLWPEDINSLLSTGSDPVDQQHLVAALWKSRASISSNCQEPTVLIPAPS